MKIGTAGIALIKRNEGCRLRAYLDTIAEPPVWTIGYGETGPYVYEGLRWTQDQAEMGLARRLANEFCPGVMAAIGDAPTTQNQFDAMTSLAWNIGLGAFQQKSSVPKWHRIGAYAAAAQAFALWNKAGGVVVLALTRRRAEEAALYLSNAPAAAHRTLYFTVPPMAGKDVTDLQRLLDEHAAPCDVDGEFGPQTRNALMTFQRHHAGLRVDGICGPATWAALAAA